MSLFKGKLFVIRNLEEEQKHIGYWFEFEACDSWCQRTIFYSAEWWDTSKNRWLKVGGPKFSRAEVMADAYNAVLNKDMAIFQKLLFRRCLARYQSDLRAQKTQILLLLIPASSTKSSTSASSTRPSPPTSVCLSAVSLNDFFVKALLSWSKLTARERTVVHLIASHPPNVMTILKMTTATKEAAATSRVCGGDNSRGKKTARL